MPEQPAVTPVELPAGVVLRLLHPGDGPALAAAYDRDRDHLEPWEPARPAAFHEAGYHTARIPVLLLEHGAGRAVPLVLVRDDAIVGRLNLTGIERGAARSAHVGYWLASDLTGHGVMTAAVQAGAAHARDVLGLHRLQAATLLHNHASQGVLARTGFVRIGLAPQYLHIAGRWQDHVLFQRVLSDDPA
jgi:ribosomal-protein-alanine N-acetyltransferase